MAGVQQLPPELKDKFAELSRKPYDEQAKWFLNAFWTTKFANDEKNCETVYESSQQMKDLDWVKKATGCELNEALFHKFLENRGETLTVLEARAKLRQIDIDMNGYVSMSEYLLFRFECDVARLVMPQADPVEVKAAQEKVSVAQAAVQELTAALQVQKAALLEVQNAELQAKAALEELKAQEEAFQKKIKELEEKSTTGSVVAKGKAKAELEQLKAGDPLPLRRAKITQEASVRRVEKARKEAQEATAKAEAAATAAEKKLDEAQKYLEDVRSRVGSSEGSFWWMDREMREARKYMPQRGQRNQEIGTRFGNA